MILLVGYKGSIGRRYHAILKALNIPHMLYDKADNGSDNFLEMAEQASKVLIASPTNTHYDWCMFCIEMGKPFLCEKPLAFSLEECDEIIEASSRANVTGHVVNNYEFGLQETSRIRHFPTKLDYYNTGKEAGGPLWHCCQLVYINPEIVIKQESPVWNLSTVSRKREYLLPYRTIEQSYIEMIDAWHGGGNDRLWTLQDGRHMTEIVLERIKLGN